MGREPRYPYSPARIMARAYKVGLTALKDLLRERVITNLRDVYDSTLDMWTEAQGKWEESKKDGQRDFSHITNVENHMRSNFLKMIWETTARYGNREYKRVKSERKGKIGPLNRLLNMAGAQMRNYAVTRFPFPMPDEFGRNGRERVYGYEGDETYPQVQVTHATLPEMDFVDMIRSHVFELCRKCYVNNVPMMEARRYVNLLIYRLSPFLEYLYTSGESGRWGFKRKRRKRSDGEEPDADHILRGIVKEIDTFHGKSNGRPRSVTDRLSKEYEPQGVSLFLDESMRLRESKDEEQEEWGIYLRRLCNNELLRDRDTQWLQEEVKRRARWYGIRLHRILTMGLPQPYNARSVILEGDKFAKVGDDLLIVAELPLKTNLGDGRADLVIFRRHLIERQGQLIPVWKPIAVFDIKSKSAFDWWIEAEEKESKKHGSITVPKIMLRHRGLREEEWVSVKQHSLSDYERRQLEVYAGSLKYAYSELTGDESNQLPVMGTILIDSAQDSAVLRKKLVRLIDSLFSDYCDDLSPQIGQKLVISQDEYDTQHLRLSLVVPHINPRQRVMLQEQGHPLDEQVSDLQLNEESNLTLYCSVPSGSRSGPSAAWIAKYWHGLEYVHSLVKDCVVWIDVSGDFRSKRLAWSRLRLDRHDSEIQQFFRELEIVDASHQFQSFLFEGKTMPTLKSILDDGSCDSNSRMIVVSGWETLEGLVPNRLRSALRECKLHLLEDLSDNRGTVLWFEQPRSGEATSSVYQRKKTVPFYDYSDFFGRVKEVVWNLPVQPYATGQTTPMLDDLRVIVSQYAHGTTADFIETQVLCDWSSRFWNLRNQYKGENRIDRRRGRQSLTFEQVLASESLCDDLLNSARDLIQGLQSDSLNEERQPVSVLLVERLGDAQERLLRTPILTFRPKVIGTRSGRGYVASSTTLPDIYFKRGYRTHIWRNSMIKRSYTPPTGSCLVTDGIDVFSVYQKETNLIFRVLRLIRNLDSSREWLSFIQKAHDMLERCSKLNSTRLFTEFLRNHPVSAVLWEQLAWQREKMLYEGLTVSSRLELENLVQENPTLCLDTGNYIFLLILDLKRRMSSITDDDMVGIWSRLKTWHLVQIGFYTSAKFVEVTGRFTFELRKVWQDITRQARLLVDASSPGVPNVRYGRVMVVEGEEGNHEFWLILQKRFRSSETISGMWQNVSPIAPSDRFQWSVNRSDVLAASAIRAASPLEADDLAVTEFEGNSYLWILDGDSWNPVGQIEFIKRIGGEKDWIRGVKTHPTMSCDLPDWSAPMSNPAELNEIITSSLEQVQNLANSCLAVECSIDIDSENYVLTLHSAEKEGKVVHEQLVFKRTQELVDFLRNPLTTGKPIEVDTNSSQRYTWNPYTDIHYDVLEILRPYVERKNPFVRTRIPLPNTAIELIQSRTESVDLVIKHDIHQCPLWLGINDDHAACWILEGVDDVPEAIVSMLSVGLTDVEIGEILKVQDIHIQGVRYKVHIEFPSEEHNDRIVFRESNIFARYLHEKRVPRASFLRMNEEILLWNIVSDSNLINVSIQSNITGDVVYSGPLVNLFNGMDIELAMEHVETTIETIVENQCSGNACERIQSYDELLEKVNEIIIENV